MGCLRDSASRTSATSQRRTFTFVLLENRLLIPSRPLSLICARRLSIFGRTRIGSAPLLDQRLQALRHQASLHHGQGAAGHSVGACDRRAGHVNLNARRDHACRTVRITAASRSASTSPPTRTTTSPMTISTISPAKLSKRANLTTRPTGATIPDASSLRRHANNCDGSSRESARSPTRSPPAQTFPRRSDPSPRVTRCGSSAQD
jgi:hypothetical protein